MARPPRPYKARIRHPVSGAPIRLSALSARALDVRVHHVDELRAALEVGAKSEDDVDRELRRMVHGPITLERAARAYAAQSTLAKNTKRDVESFLNAPARAIAARELAGLDAPTVDAWLEELRGKGLAGASVAAYWRRLRAIGRYATLRGWIGREPWGAYRPRRVVAAATSPKAGREAARSLGEVEKLLSAAGGLDAEMALRGFLPAARPKIATAIALGLRQGELAGLRWSDILESDGFVVIVRQFAGEGPKTSSSVKVLSAGPELFAILAAWREELEARALYAPLGPVFPCPSTSTPGRPRAYSSGECLSRRTLRAVVQRAQLPNPKLWSPHSLRDTFATLESHAHRGDLRTVADRTRHASISSLLRYLRSARERGAAVAPGFVLPTNAPGGLAPAPSPTAHARLLPPPHPKK
jgi:integrase